jgi:hypothetical protein
MTPASIISRLKTTGLTLRYIAEALGITRGEAKRLCEFHGAKRDRASGKYRLPSLKRVLDAERVMANPEVRQ